LRSTRQILIAILAVFMSPLILLGINLHVRR
jgi:hypothetical protein